LQFLELRTIRLKPVVHTNRITRRRVDLVKVSVLQREADLKFLDVLADAQGKRSVPSNIFSSQLEDVALVVGSLGHECKLEVATAEVRDETHVDPESMLRAGDGR
jgi:hypothetical protein